jgi:hypothetical protein
VPFVSDAWKNGKALVLQAYFYSELNVFSILGPLVTFRYFRLNHSVLNIKKFRETEI